MDEANDLKELLKTLRSLGVKAATFREEGVLASVEFFPAISPLDLDTLVPPAPAGDDPEVTLNIPEPIARMLRKPSVS